MLHGVEVEIRELAGGGDGVAFVHAGGERRAVFVRGAAPGDLVTVEVDLKTRPARGRLLSITRPGPGRVAPACPDTDRCGGCPWMHLSIEAQTAAVEARIRAHLPESWRHVPLTVTPPPRALGYRTRARVHVVARRRGRLEIGFFAPGSHDPVDVERCRVLDPTLDQARLSLPSLLEEAVGRGEAQLALGAAGKPVLDLRWEGTLAPSTFARIEQGVIGGRWAGVRVHEGDASRPAVIGEPSPWTTGADGFAIRLAPGGFAQASEHAGAVIGERLVAAARTALAKPASDDEVSLGTVLELYAGAGNFTVLLARGAARLTAVETDPEACAAARENLASRGLPGKVVQGLAEQHAVKRPTDLVVLDPPRTGARAVAEKLVLARPRAIAYVSCDVATLARDLAILAPRYTPVSMSAFAIFPHTPHIEVLAVLRRAEVPSGERDPASRPPGAGS